jgi:hypothetical protein
MRSFTQEIETLRTHLTRLDETYFLKFMGTDQMTDVSIRNTKSIDLVWHPTIEHAK